MLIYAINRILYLIPVLFILSVVVFSSHFLPGDVIDVLAGQEGVVDPAIGRRWSTNTGSINPSIRSISSG
jgi:ABC-type dipeptide/oligopeptide/nickel transport system permease component